MYKKLIYAKGGLKQSHKEEEDWKFVRTIRDLEVDQFTPSSHANIKKKKNQTPEKQFSGLIREEASMQT